MAKKPAKKVAAAKSDAKSEAVVTALCEVLASTYTLYLKTQNFHWNVVGPWFSQLHPFFEGQYKALAEAVDEIAERIRALGYVAPGSFSMFARLSHIEEAPTSAPRDEEMISLLLDDHNKLSKLAYRVINISQEAGDEVTADMMIGRATAHDKAAWMLRSHLE
jgi:starvation-inducible DNA-binding protein